MKSFCCCLNMSLNLCFGHYSHFLNPLVYFWPHQLWITSLHWNHLATFSTVLNPGFTMAWIIKPCPVPHFILGLCLRLIIMPHWEHIVPNMKWNNNRLICNPIRLTRIWQQRSAELEVVKMNTPCFSFYNLHSYFFILNCYSLLLLCIREETGTKQT